MAWDSCNLTINSVNDGFQSGDIITGIVTLGFKRPQKIKRIDFRVIGISKARWSRATPTIPYIKIYSEKIKLYDVNSDIFSELNGTKVETGFYNFRFHFVLPPDLPSSFRSSIASVEYCIHVTSKMSCNRKKKMIYPFNVIQNVNINEVEEFQIPSLYEFGKTFWNSTEFSVYMKTYRGFGPGQNIQFEVLMNNDKKINVTKIKVILIQKRDYMVSSGHHSEEKEINKTEHKGLKSDAKENCTFFMSIPFVIPSSLNLSDDMITISYILRVVICFRFHFSLYKDIPVTIASIPVIHKPFV